LKKTKEKNNKKKNALKETIVYRLFVKRVTMYISSSPRVLLDYGSANSDGPGVSRLSRQLVIGTHLRGRKGWLCGATRRLTRRLLCLGTEARGRLLDVLGRYAGRGLGVRGRQRRGGRGGGRADRRDRQAVTAGRWAPRIRGRPALRGRLRGARPTHRHPGESALFNICCGSYFE
jgi:hypothetical protein